jgi:hypothetical protein|tara:strand:+ start:19 stop:699 length:681 start_codon:yes stop_codon:yes gene_type:complete
MAQSFTALGKGNGFNRCLGEIDLNGSDKTILNAPTLEQTMNAYWNFDSATFGAATFNPNNQPVDLLCNENANRGSDFAYDPTDSAYYDVRHQIANKFTKNGVIGYIHGIRFNYQQSETSIEDDNQSVIEVNWFSSYYSPLINESTCITSYASSQAGGTYPFGKVKTAVTSSVSAVTIGGLPFVKFVRKEFQGFSFDDPIGSGNAVCQTPYYLPEPTSQPSLSFHTY